MDVDYYHKYLKYKSKYLTLKDNNKGSMLGGKRKKQRKGPRESATLYTVGTKKTGNDGNKWIVVENKLGTKRWKLYKKINKDVSRKSTFIPKHTLTSKSNEYDILDDHIYPFRVIISNKGVYIYTYEGNYTEEVFDAEYTKLLTTFTNFIGYWPGYDAEEGIHGDSILIQINQNTYVVVAGETYQFTTNEPIIDFLSPRWGGYSNSIAYSDNYVYFLGYKQYIARTDLKTPVDTKDPFDLLNEVNSITHHKSKKKHLVHNIKHKVLIKMRR